MSRISYVNGSYVPHADAKISVDDRGFQFADGVYEVIAIYNRNLIDYHAHLLRLKRSLKELCIEEPISDEALLFVMTRLIRINHILHGKLYLQVTRGIAPRDHQFPLNAKSSLIITVNAVKWPTCRQAKEGVSVVTGSDLRWKRCDIKSVSLLPNVLAKQSAIEVGVDEIWLVNGEGIITEGSASNAWIIDKNGVLVTHPLGHQILSGVTRDTVLKLAQSIKIDIEQRPFTVKDAQQSKEAFYTSSTTLIKPVVSINKNKIGSGSPGRRTCQLIDEYYNFIENITV